MVSERELISHIFRRLGYGSQPELVSAATTRDDALAAALDLNAAADESFYLDPPVEGDPAGDRAAIAAVIEHWLTQLIASPRRIEERLVWFWHDHFATDLRKVKVPYLMYVQQQTVRQHATGSFADLLHAIAVDPAMLIYLDGTQNSADAINENFGREVMELFTLGRGHYTEDDVVAASRAFSGWIVLRPGGRAIELIDGDPWTSHFVRVRHDGGTKTLLGRTARLDAPAAVDVLLEQNRTAEFVGAKLFEHLVGLAPDAAATSRIAAAFRRDYQILDLVAAIVDEPAFLSDNAVRVKVRSPLEKVVGVIQAFGRGRESFRLGAATLRTMGYLPFVPPNVAGFPAGPALLDPHRLVHTFDLVALVAPPADDLTVDEVMNRLGVFDISPPTRTVLESVDDSGGRIALAINSPEHHVV